MRHRTNKRAFGRRPDARKALFRGLATSLVEHERIVTTITKAKELRKVVEPLVTLAKRGDLHARRKVAAYLYKKKAVSKLFEEIADRFKTRPGGYTRIYRQGFRRGDGAETAIIEFLPSEAKSTKTKEPKVKAKATKKETTKKAPLKKATKKATSKKKTETKKEKSA
ncbi:MAG: 50S ribosomal protein L17 [Bdellovibrionales bacterium]|nr:50S ribosomal protein L17 [Bdellovibrionales bacterium]